MIISRVKRALIFLLLLAAPFAAQAESDAPEPVEIPAETDGRAASFMPPDGKALPVATTAPEGAENRTPAIAPAPPEAIKSESVKPESAKPESAETVPAAASGGAGSAISANSSAAEKSLPSKPEAVGSPGGPDAASHPPTVVAPPASQATPEVNPPAVTSPAQQPVVPASVPAVIGKPVEAEKLQQIDPDSIGLLSPEDGGLGAGMWKGTPRELVNHVLPTLSLPTPSDALNSLARRFLLTAASVPEGSAGKPLSAMRVEKLVALGDPAGAWQLASLAGPEKIDDITLRLAVEAGLVGPEAGNICAKLPSLLQAHESPEWQKSMVVCQLQDKNVAAAQLGLDVLHTQEIRDEPFFHLAERNVIGGAKPLPSHLTPLRPLNLALLRLTDRPLPSEIYARPEASVIPELLLAPTRGDKARLALAERAAERGLISAHELGQAYAAAVFTEQQRAGTPEKGPRLRAMLYQAALAEKLPTRRYDTAVSFIESLGSVPVGRIMAATLLAMLGDAKATSERLAHAPLFARLHLLAGDAKEAAPWIALTRQAAAGSAKGMSNWLEIWPYVALSGTENETDYAPNLGKWLDAGLKDADHERRERAGDILLLFDAAGLAVPNKEWARVTEMPTGEKKSLPPSALLLERLRMAGENGRQGEVVLLSLALAGSETPQLQMLTAVTAIRALRLAGLSADALALARETASPLLLPAAAKP